MLSCNSTRASICGLALSWKYKPHALGASHKIEEFGLNKIANVNTGKINLNLEIGKIDDSPLCNGKLVKACGLGGLCKTHSKLVADLSLSIL
jgi:hypothetical protein